MLLGSYLNFCFKCSDSWQRVEGNAEGSIRHADAKLVLYEFLFRKHGLSAVSGLNSSLNQEGNVAERGPLATVGESLATLI